ncbi:hypothetical protein SLE2022_012950 [Rubroshorea leprosula]
MSAFHKLYWAWMSFAKLNLGWVRLQLLFSQCCSKSILLQGKLLHLFCVIRGSWLTRFVRFVSTSEVLERFVTVKKEIE